MKIFALDTSSKVATIGILEDDKVLLENTLNDNKTHSENLMPMIEAAFHSVNLTPGDMDVFGVTVGPGAFTGLRIGISTIKGMAEALGKPVVGLSSLDVLAAGVPPTDRIICPILDAQRNQVYAGLYQYQGDSRSKTENEEPIMTRIRDTEVIKIQELIEIGARWKGKVLFVGDGVNLHEKALKEGFGAAYERSFFAHRIPRASVVGALTRRKHREGKSCGAETLKPVYLRKSQAEVQFDQHQESLRKERVKE